MTLIVFSEYAQRLKNEILTVFDKETGLDFIL